MDKTMTPNQKMNEEKRSKSSSERSDAVEDAASYAGKKTEDAVSYVGHKAEDAASYVGDKAEDAASYAGHKAEDAKTATGGGLRSLGQSVREHGPEGGRAGHASSAVADSLESSGRYIQEEGIKDMAEDVTNLVRRNPIPALLLSVAAGFLLARATTPRN